MYIDYIFLIKYIRECGRVFCLLECLEAKIVDVWCCFVLESMDFADKMGDCGLGGQIEFVTFCGKNS